MVARVVDQHIDSPVFEFDLLEQVDAGLRVGDVHRADLDARLVAEFLGDGFEFFLAAGGKHEVGTGFGEQARGLCADAFGAAGDDNGSVFENHRRRVMNTPTLRKRGGNQIPM